MAVLTGEEALAQAQIVDGLQNVGLSCSVGTVEQIDLWGEVHLRPLVSSEGLKAESQETHGVGSRKKRPGTTCAGPRRYADLLQPPTEDQVAEEEARVAVQVWGPLEGHQPREKSFSFAVYWPEIANGSSIGRLGARNWE